MRAVIWCAVSSKPQLEGDSLQQQETDGIAAAERFGWAVMGVLSVPGHSRDYWQYDQAAQDIPAYAELQRMAEARAFDVLICRGRDRLGRSDSLIANVEYLLRQNKIQVYSMAMPSVIVDPEQSATDRGSLIASSFERTAAQIEIIELRRRYDSGMSGRIKRGLHPGKGMFGYEQLPGEKVFTQVPEEVAILREVYWLYMKGWGVARIAGHLNADSAYPSPKGSRWRHGTLRYILSNIFYAGWVRHGQTIGPGKHEPVFTAEEWSALETEKRRRSQTRGKAASPFSGLVKCRVCGRRMSITTSRKYRASGALAEYRYYRCSEGVCRQQEQRAGVHSTMVKLDEVERAVLNKSQELLDPVALEEACRGKDVEDRERLLALRDTLEKELDEHEAVVRRLLDAHTRWGTVGKEAFDQAMSEAAEHQERLEAQLAEVMEQLTGIPDPETRLRLLMDFTSDVKARLAAADVQEANAWLSRAIRWIWCEGNRVVEVELV